MELSVCMIECLVETKIHECDPSSTGIFLSGSVSLFWACQHLLTSPAWELQSWFNMHWKSKCNTSRQCCCHPEVEQPRWWWGWHHLEAKPKQTHLKACKITPTTFLLSRLFCSGWKLALTLWSVFVTVHQQKSRMSFNPPQETLNSTLYLIILFQCIPGHIEPICVRPFIVCSLQLTQLWVWSQSQMRFFFFFKLCPSGEWLCVENQVLCKNESPIEHLLSKVRFMKLNRSWSRVYWNHHS